MFTPTVVKWNRITDSEYRMINKLALTLELGATLNSVYTNYRGTIKIVSELPYCVSCQGVIQQFNQMFPNVN